jgi:hypothetical protein
VAGYQVAEAARMDARHGAGKSDPLDAHRIAAAALPLDEQQLRRPRLNEGVRAVLQALVTARKSMTTGRTRAVNALTALPRVNDPARTCAICLTAWSHHGRIRSEAAFASPAGVNPIPASSGNTIRHRLNRGGDRALNNLRSCDVADTRQTSTKYVLMDIQCCTNET